VDIIRSRDNRDPTADLGPAEVPATGT
jgi:hypothetical protein